MRGFNEGRYSDAENLLKALNEEFGMSSALRLLADKIEGWQKNDRLERREKDEMLTQLLGP